MEQKPASEHPSRSRTAENMASSVFNVKDMSSMHQSLNSEFMLYQLILRQVLTYDNKSIAENGLLEYFKPEKKEDQETFKEFDTTYKPNAAIHWYTKDTCIYRMINRALRTHNTKDLLGFTKFLRDVKVQLEQEQKSFSRKFQVPEAQMYSAQYISKDDMNRIQSSVGQLISINSFLWTSINYKKTLTSAISKPPPSDGQIAILLEISVSLKGSTRPFADVKHLNASPNEEDILFMFGSIFRIDNIWEDTRTKIWRAKFTLCNETDQDYRVFMTALANDLGQKDQLVVLGHYMLEIQSFIEAESHYRTLLEGKAVNNDFNLATCHHGLARVYIKKGDYDLALENIETALKYLSKATGKKNTALIAECYNDYGSIYCKKGDIRLAFRYYEKALRIHENNKTMTYAGLSEVHIQMEDYYQAVEFQHKRLDTLSKNESCRIAATFIDLGKIYGLMNETDRSLDMFDKAIQIQKKNLNENHPDLGCSYNGIALMYLEVGDLDKALKHINKALNIQMKTLPLNHPDFCETYENFGNLYLKQNDKDQALVYFKKLLDCQILTLSLTHPSVSDTELLIGRIYLEKGNFSDSLVYYKRSLDSQLERKPFGDSLLSVMYKQIAEIHMKADNLDEALECYHKMLDNDLERKVLEDRSFTDIYRIMADIYCRKRDFHRGLFYYYRLLDCQLKARPFKEAAVIQTYELIGDLYMKKSCDQTLLNFNESFRDDMDKKLSMNGVLLGDHTIIDNIHFEKRHLDQTLFYFKYAYDHQLKKGSVDDELLIKTLTILGNISTDRNEFDQALVYMTQLLKMEIKRKPFDDPSLINIYKTMGKIYFEKYDFDKALLYYNRLLDAQLRMNSFNNPDIDETCIKIGRIYFVRPFSEKLTMFNKLLGYEIKNEQSTHRSDDDIPQAAADDEESEQRHFDRVLHYFEQLIINHQDDTSLPNAMQHTDIHKILGNIAIEKCDWSLALLYYDRLRKETPDDAASLIDIDKTIGTILYEQNDLHQALIYYQKALDNELLGKKPNNPSLIIIFKVMASIFYQLAELPKALMYFNHLLDCQVRAKSDTETSTDETYKMILKIYAKKPYDRSFRYSTGNSVQFQQTNNVDATNDDLNFEIRHLDEALRYFQKNLDRRSQSGRSPSQRLYKVLANICLEKNDFNQALTYLNEAVELALKRTPADDPSHQDRYKIIATLYHKRQDLDQALYYVNQWLDCLSQTDTSDNPSLSEAYILMGEIFYVQSTTFDHLSYLVKKFYANNPGGKLSEQDLDRIIRRISDERRHLSDAIEFFQNLHMKKRQLPLTRESSSVKLFTILRNMYLHKRDLKQGLEFFQKLLRDELRNNQGMNKITAILYENIGYLNAELGERHNAVTSYRKSLDIYNKNLPSNKSTVAVLQNKVNEMMKNQTSIKLRF